MTPLQILDVHRQLRVDSCFQMAPELALKLAGLLGPNEYPLQNLPHWDGKGYEWNDDENTVALLQARFFVTTYTHPYTGMMARFREEIGRGYYPIVSLRPEPGVKWHGYVVSSPIDNNDSELLTKASPDQFGNSRSHIDRLSNRLRDQTEKVDCLFWIPTS